MDWGLQPFNACRPNSPEILLVFAALEPVPVYGGKSSGMETQNVTMVAHHFLYIFVDK